MAINSKRVIGDKNKLIWSCPEDLAHFKKLTLDQIVVMGRATWDGLPFRPLPKRHNVVISKTLDLPMLDNLEQWSSLEDLVSEYHNPNTSSMKGHDMWIIGGATLFQSALSHIKEVHLTILHNNTSDGDTILPKFEHQFRLESEQVLNQDDNVVVYKYTRR